jgi:hypothetical protein
MPRRHGRLMSPGQEHDQRSLAGMTDDPDRPAGLLSQADEGTGADDIICIMCEVRAGSSPGGGYRTPRRRASATASMREDTPSFM